MSNFHLLPVVEVEAYALSPRESPPSGRDEAFDAYIEACLVDCGFADLMPLKPGSMFYDVRDLKAHHWKTLADHRLA